MPLTVAGSTYQFGVAFVGVGPYFQYWVPTGNGCGYTIVIAMVAPGAQPVVVKSNRPCGNEMPAGALPAGGLAAWPSSVM